MCHTTEQIGKRGKISKRKNWKEKNRGNFREEGGKLLHLKGSQGKRRGRVHHPEDHQDAGLVKKKREKPLSSSGFRGSKEVKGKEK